MKTYYVDAPLKYDGTQLQSLFAYLNYKIMGDSIVSFQGACDVSLDHMVDGEDLLENAKICGDHMLHFIIEKFGIELYGAVGLQRLTATLCMELLRELSPVKNLTERLRREGDDIYVDDKKLSISIATVSPTSALIHFAVNVKNDGTPVSTLCLEELEINPADFAKALMEKVAKEDQGLIEATQKVKWVK